MVTPTQIHPHTGQSRVTFVLYSCTHVAEHTIVLLIHWFRENAELDSNVSSDIHGIVFCPSLWLNLTLLQIINQLAAQMYVCDVDVHVRGLCNISCRYEWSRTHRQVKCSQCKAVQDGGCFGCYVTNTTQKLEQTTTTYLPTHLKNSLSHSCPQLCQDEIFFSSWMLHWLIFCRIQTSTPLQISVFYTEDSPFEIKCL